MPNRGLAGSKTTAMAAAAVRATGIANMGMMRKPFISTIDADKVFVAASESTNVNVVWL